MRHTKANIKPIDIATILELAEVADGFGVVADIDGVGVPVAVEDPVVVDVEDPVVDVEDPVVVGIKAGHGNECGFTKIGLYHGP